ncbi:uncharacterized protein B0I36DRAFT_354970 [Microdochium trichocladiopsis]|uniref:Uncharacterized protein n=1 Tax=Microdochium trichocladiopsis TaxID=1682393 RepID=A0A9P9BJL5_9PEZI|nr:uncharacterized protein B0I36DRAFT_354970 [Microdochium trichocladiopsis]KAH7016104.1 hypothetical protein B0I36DRAFT_354970 [Microdochium trichocladiopsis]
MITPTIRFRKLTAIARIGKRTAASKLDLRDIPPEGSTWAWGVPRCTAVAVGPTQGSGGHRPLRFLLTASTAAPAGAGLLRARVAQVEAHGRRRMPRSKKAKVQELTALKLVRAYGSISPAVTTDVQSRYKVGANLHFDDMSFCPHPGAHRRSITDDAPYTGPVNLRHQRPL